MSTESYFCCNQLTHCEEHKQQVTCFLRNQHTGTHIGKCPICHVRLYERVGALEAQSSILEKENQNLWRAVDGLPWSLAKQIITDFRDRVSLRLRRMAEVVRP